MIRENTCLTFRYMTFPFKLNHTNVPKQYHDDPIILYLTAMPANTEPGYFCEAYIGFYRFTDLHILDQFKINCTMDELPNEMDLLADNISTSSRYVAAAANILKGNHHVLNRVF